MQVVTTTGTIMCHWNISACVKHRVCPVAPQSSGCPSPSSSCAQTRCVGSWLHLKSCDAMMPKGARGSAEFLFGTKCGANFGKSSGWMGWLYYILYYLYFSFVSYSPKICLQFVFLFSKTWLANINPHLCFNLWQLCRFPRHHPLPSLVAGPFAWAHGQLATGQAQHQQCQLHGKRGWKRLEPRGGNFEPGAVWKKSDDMKETLFP